MEEEEREGMDGKERVCDAMGEKKDGAQRKGRTGEECRGRDRQTDRAAAYGTATKRNEN